MDCKAVAGFCQALLEELGARGALSVVFVGTGRMRALNRRYRRRDYATDVLSFSYGGLWVESRKLLGEIVLAPGVAAQQPRAEAELRKLLLHGVLHLLGYDHESDRGRMKRVEGRLRRRLMFRRGVALADFGAGR